MCSGQKRTGSPPPRSGPVAIQLAPAFLDEMSACHAEHALPADLIAKTRDGTINTAGDCDYASIGVTCHYHSGAEFITSSTTRQTPGQGELHCIFPSADPKSPSVYGGHVVCSGAGPHRPAGEVAHRPAGEDAHRPAGESAHRPAGEDAHRPAGEDAHVHDVKAGARCAAGLLSQLTSCRSFRCCDDGTLTNPIADLVREGRNDVRPDFRICDDTIVIDCALLANLAPHDADSPALGGVGAPVFTAVGAH